MILTILGILGIVGILWVWQNLSLERPVFVWTPDARVSYDLTWTTDLGTRKQTFSDGKLSATTAAEKGRLQMTGVLNLRIHSVSSQKILASLQISPVKMSGGDTAASDALVQTFGAVALVNFSPQGRMLSVEVPAQEERGRSLEAMLRAMEIVLPLPEEFDGQGWKTFQEDLTGRGPVSYSLKTSSSGVRRRLGYSTLYHMPDATVRAFTDNATQEFSLASDCWLTSYTSTETLHVMRGSKPWFESMTTFGLKRRDRVADQSAMLWSLPQDFGAARLALAKLRLPATVQQLPADDDVLLLLIDRMAKNLKVDGKDPHLALWDYLRTHPEACRKIPGFFRPEAGMEDTWNAALIHALQKAGHAVAQEVLLTIATDTMMTQMNRLRALAALGAIDSPTIATRKAMRKLWEERGPSAQEQECARVTALAMGTMASSTRTKNPFVAREITDYVSAQLQATASDDAHARISLLGALGNAADATTLGLISPSITAESQSERVAALRALRGMNDTESLNCLLDRVRMESTTTVREAAAKVLAGRSATAQAVATVVESFGGESSPDIRVELAHFIGRNKAVESGVTADQVKALVSRETSTDVLKVLLSYYTPAELSITK